MFDPEQSESPLVRFELARHVVVAPGDTGVIACERAFLSHINLRGDPQNGRFIAAAHAALRVALPIAPNTVTEAQSKTSYWLGPDEWLIVAKRSCGAAIEAKLREALAGEHSSVTDVSGGQTSVILRGDRVREVTAKGCPLDLHPRVFGIGQCAQSLLAKVPILIRMIDLQPAFEIIVRRSFADYFWLWLEDAAAEYGFAVTA